MSEQIRINRVVSKLQVETHLTGRFTSLGLEERMRHYYTPGVSITVVNNGKVAWSKGFGCKNVLTKEKVGDDTMFLAGSVSKPVFALAVTKLAEAGRLNLDKDVNNYLKRWKIPKNGGWQPGITMRQLLSHTAGMTVQGFSGYGQSEDVPGIVEILNGRPPANTDPVVVNILPGTMLRYSGGGITVAQLVVEDILGKPFHEIMDEVLFKPLGLKNSTYNQSLSQKHKKKIAHGHPFYNKHINGGYHLYPEMAAAGLWSNGHDLAALMLEVQKAFNGESSFFSKKNIKEMLTPQKIAKNIGYGFFLEGTGSAERFYHNGWDEGFVAKFVSYMRGGTGAVILLNSNAGNPMIDEILRAIALEYGWADYLPRAVAACRLARGRLEGYCGSYKAETGLKFTVQSKAGKLELGLEGQPPVGILPQSRTEFFSDVINLKVRFKFGKSGKAGRLSIIQGTNAIKAERQPG